MITSEHKDLVVGTNNDDYKTTKLVTKRKCIREYNSSMG